LKEGRKTFVESTDLDARIVVAAVIVLGRAGEESMLNPLATE
jgi:hypothetical protein